MSLLAVLTDCVGCEAVKTAAEASASDGFVLPTVLLSGLIDGFNPCAFSVVITLAGILAVGGRQRRARLLGGWSFCLGSFLTYMLMGVGLLQALRAFRGLETIRTVTMTVLALALFTCSFLSLRDALQYQKAREPSVIVLQLPTRVKRWIRSVAEASWRGSSVVFAGLLCGFVVTLLDSLCTGQVYLPVLALLANEPGSWRTFGYLVAYNLAFIAPLVAVFALAAKGADSETLARWSKRNVIPAKLALAFIFLVLGALIMPRFGAPLAEWLAAD